VTIQLYRIGLEKRSQRQRFIVQKSAPKVSSGKSLLKFPASEQRETGDKMLLINRYTIDSPLESQFFHDEKWCAVVLIMLCGFRDLFLKMLLSLK
jgi:hypothetical protein